MIKKETDLRGSHMGEIHKEAKLLKEKYPDKKYRECVKIICNSKKENIISNDI